MQFLDTVGLEKKFTHNGNTASVARGLIEIYKRILIPSNNGDKVTYLSDIHLEQYAKSINKQIIVLRKQEGSDKLALAGRFPQPSSLPDNLTDSNTLWLYCDLEGKHYYSMSRDHDVLLQSLDEDSKKFLGLAPP